ncbi:MAG: flagellar export protein FliJ [Desulfobacterales bacterium]|nr:flagellar export protein FliJ [Desulfobacterales bacterium]
MLTQRRHAEELLQCELSAARQALSAEQAALREAKNARSRCMRALHAAQEARFRASEVLLYYPYLERLAASIETQSRRVTLAERRVTQKRHALIEAMKKRKVLEKLRDKQARAYQHEAAAFEQRIHDEAGAQQHGRR